jgi:hypothetical protein
VELSRFNFVIINNMGFEDKINADNMKTIVKSLSTMENMTLTKLKILINHKFNKTDGLNNFSKKLNTKTIKATELFEIFDVLGYDLVVKKK